MKISKISFSNYKAFSSYQKQEMVLKPITLLIGKNSAGKSSIGKLFTLLESSLNGEISVPFLLKNQGVQLAASYKDIFNNSLSPLKLELILDDNSKISIELFCTVDGNSVLITKWEFYNPSNVLEISLQIPDDLGRWTNMLDNEIYECTFKGFLLQEAINAKTKKPFGKTFSLGSKIIVDYIGPFRVLPERCFTLSGNTDFIYTGIQGEHAYNMLGMSKQRGEDLHEKVGNWYKEKFGGWQLTLNTLAGKYKEIVLEHQNNPHTKVTQVNLVDVGQGMNQALPLVVRAYRDDQPASIIVLEQPELHLHPAAHADLAELFVESAKQHNHTFIIETHSENILLRVRKLAIEQKYGFTHEDIIIYWVNMNEDGTSELEEISIDEFGELSDWPVGVFSEEVQEILAIQSAIYSKKNNRS